MDTSPQRYTALRGDDEQGREFRAGSLILTKRPRGLMRAKSLRDALCKTGIITPEMEFVAIRENQALRET